MWTKKLASLLTLFFIGCGGPSTSTSEESVMQTHPLKVRDSGESADHACRILLVRAQMDGCIRSNCWLSGEIDVNSDLVRQGAVPSLAYTNAPGSYGWSVGTPTQVPTPAALVNFQRFSFKLQIQSNSTQLIPFYTLNDERVYDHNRTEGNYVLNGNKIVPDEKYFRCIQVPVYQDQLQCQARCQLRYQSLTLKDPHQVGETLFSIVKFYPKTYSAQKLQTMLEGACSLAGLKHAELRNDTFVSSALLQKDCQPNPPQVGCLVDCSLRVGENQHNAQTLHVKASFPLTPEVIDHDRRFATAQTICDQEAGSVTQVLSVCPNAMSCVDGWDNREWP